MSFFSLVAALLLEHFRPLPQRVQLNAIIARYGNFLERHFNAGRYRYGLLAWSLAVLPALFGVALAFALLDRASPVLGFAFNVLVLYLTLTLGPLVSNAGQIAQALREGRLDAARTKVGQADGIPVDNLSANAVARLAIERLFCQVHRQVFGVMFWFVLLGAGGALAYRVAQILQQKWGALDHAEYGRFGQFADDAFGVIDWLPLRLAAVSFAVVGDFEDAIRCWQEQAVNWVQRAQGIILASGAGALGVRLGEPIEVNGELRYRAPLGLGDEADADYIDSAVSLVWRAVALWLGVLLLLTLARWAGG